MPEYQERMRLGELRGREWEAANDLVSRMWAIEAQTPATFLESSRAILGRRVRAHSA
jgi:hypothetical protein